MHIDKIRQKKIFLLHWIVQLYDWVLVKASHRLAVPILCMVGFTESIFFPIPPDVMLLPMMLAQPKRSFLLAGLLTLSSVLGAAVGYWLGFAMYEQVAMPLLSFYGYEHAYQLINDLFAKYGNYLVFAGGFSPIPYKVIVLGAGFAQMNFLAFMVISVLARAGRFFLLATLLWFFGDAIQKLINKYFGLLTIAFCLLVVIAVFALKYMH